MDNKSKYEMAHFNPKEVEVLDETQGGRRNMPNTDIRLMDVLEHLLSDKNNEKMLMKQYERHAKGGSIGEILREADRMRSRGRNGDSEVAFIGPNTKRIFNKLMHGGSVNPSTNKAEYFNLGGMIGGIGKTLSRGLSGMGKTLGGVGSKVLGGLQGALPGAIMGGMEGGPEGALAGGLSSFLSNQGGTTSRPPQNLNNLGQQFMNSSYPQQMMGSGMGQQFMNSGMGQGMQNMYNQGRDMYNQGREMYNSPEARQFMQEGSNLYNSPQAQQARQSPGMQRMMQSPVAQRAQGAYNSARDTYNQGRNMYKEADQGYQGMVKQGQHYNNAFNNARRGHQPHDDNEGMFHVGGENIFG